MAVTTTPLGFKKPDGNELVRGGDNAIADNAQKAEDLITADRVRIANLENKALGMIEDPTDPGFFILPGGAA